MTLEEEAQERAIALAELDRSRLNALCRRHGAPDPETPTFAPWAMANPGAAMAFLLDIEAVFLADRLAAQIRAFQGDADSVAAQIEAIQEEDPGGYAEARGRHGIPETGLRDWVMRHPEAALELVLKRRHTAREQASPE